MVSSIDDVQDAITSATSSRQQRSTSITCSNFVDLVTYYTSIADDYSMAYEIISVGETIRQLDYIKLIQIESTVMQCTLMRKISNSCWPKSCKGKKNFASIKFSNILVCAM